MLESHKSLMVNHMLPLTSLSASPLQSLNLLCAINTMLFIFTSILLNCSVTVPMALGVFKAHFQQLHMWWFTPMPPGLSLHSWQTHCQCVQAVDTWSCIRSPAVECGFVCHNLEYLLCAVCTE